VHVNSYQLTVQLVYRYIDTCNTGGVVMIFVAGATHLDKTGVC